MKLRLTHEYTAYELYGTLEINTEDYPELEGMSDEEVVEYINDNIYDFKIKDSTEDNIVDTFTFEKDIIKDKEFDNEHKVVLIKE
jgi:hypothetical protein